VRALKIILATEAGLALLRYALPGLLIVLVIAYLLIKPLMIAAGVFVGYKVGRWIVKEYAIL